MNTKIVVALLIAACVSNAEAEAFYLKHDGSGQIYGPFHSNAGSAVKIGSASFTVVQKSVVLSALEKTLTQIKLPHIEMRMANLSDAVSYLRTNVEQRAPDGAVVNFLIVDPKPKPQARNTDPFASPGAAGGRSGRRQPNVTLQLRDVTALEVLNAIAENIGGSYRCEGNTVRITYE